MQNLRLIPFISRKNQIFRSNLGDILETLFQKLKAGDVFSGSESIRVKSCEVTIEKLRVTATIFVLIKIPLSSGQEPSLALFG